ncbi:MAG: hypothetical protein AB4352_03845 [Hormoscilla sp.]
MLAQTSRPNSQPATTKQLATRGKSVLTLNPFCLMNPVRWTILIAGTVLLISGTIALVWLLAVPLALVFPILMVAEVVLFVSVFPIVTWLRSIAIAIGLLIMASQQLIAGMGRLIFGINYLIGRIKNFGKTPEEIRAMQLDKLRSAKPKPKIRGRLLLLSILLLIAGTIAIRYFWAVPFLLLFAPFAVVLLLLIFLLLPIIAWLRQLFAIIGKVLKAIGTLLMILYRIAINAEAILNLLSQLVDIAESIFTSISKLKNLASGLLGGSGLARLRSTVRGVLNGDRKIISLDRLLGRYDDCC